MIRRFTGLVLALTALFVTSCKMDSDPPEPHDCLAFWGTQADALIPLLDAQKVAKGLQWGRHQQDEPTYTALKQLEESLWTALQTIPPTAPPPNPGPFDPTPIGHIPMPELDAIRNLAMLMQGGGHLDGDQMSTAHPPTLGWMNTLVTGGPTPQPVIDKATQVLTALREALDM